MAMLLWFGMLGILLDLMSLDCLGFGKACCSMLASIFSYQLVFNPLL